MLGGARRRWECWGAGQRCHTQLSIQSLHSSRDSCSSGFHPELGATAIPVSRCSICKLLFEDLNCSKTGGGSCWDGLPFPVSSQAISFHASTNHGHFLSVSTVLTCLACL